MTNHQTYMQEAITQAIKAWGQTSPNPLVGAVIEKNGHIIGTGYHQKAGEPHAEINAITSCTQNTQGATCYVTLEPCSTYGRTPACTQALIKAGISHIVIGSLDDNPLHAGKALKILSKYMKVTTSILEQDCREINKNFFHWIKYKKPLVTLKIGMTLDGKIATQDGQSKWITCSEARTFVQKLRKRCDAIMVGGQTALLDNPSLEIKENFGNNQKKSFGQTDNSQKKSKSPKLLKHVNQQQKNNGKSF